MMKCKNRLGHDYQSFPCIDYCKVSACVRQNKGIITILQIPTTTPWASEGFFQGRATRGFFQNFSRVDQTWWNSHFPTQNEENNYFLLKNWNSKPKPKT